MTTKNPRLSVTLSPESRAALERFSETTGVAASQFISSIIHDAIPVIDATTRAFQIARTSPKKAADLMTSELLKAQVLAAQGQLELDEAASLPRPRKRPRRA